MKHKKIALILAITLLASLFAGLALADDGAFFQRNVSGTPDLETERRQPHSDELLRADAERQRPASG